MKTAKRQRTPLQAVKCWIEPLEDIGFKAYVEGREDLCAYGYESSEAEGSLDLLLRVMRKQGVFITESA